MHPMPACSGLDEHARWHAECKAARFQWSRPRTCSIDQQQLYMRLTQVSEGLACRPDNIQMHPLGHIRASHQSSWNFTQCKFSRLPHVHPVVFSAACLLLSLAVHSMPMCDDRNTINCEAAESSVCNINAPDGGCISCSVYRDTSERQALAVRSPVRMRLPIRQVKPAADLCAR